MPRITVLDVGDGACTIVRRWERGSPVAVVDCGVYRGSPRAAADKLRLALGNELSQLEQIVVTHFDNDHWGGFRALADSSVRDDLPPRIEVLFPRTPEPELDPGVLRLALEATLTGTGVRSLDLFESLRRVTAPVARPLSQGQSFRLADADWEVLWPPPFLSRVLRRRLVEAVDRMEALADAMEEADFPELRQNLDLAREIAFSVKETRGGEDTEIRGHELERWDDEHDDAPEEHLVERSDDGGDGPAAVHGDPHDLARIPSRFHEPFRKASKAVADANNDLSLVFHDPVRRRLVVFGDIGGRALQEVLRSTEAWYFIALAPHHGTRVAPPGFPDAWACVSQAGSRHLRRWRRHIVSHTNDGHCVTTAQMGTITFW